MNCGIIAIYDKDNDFADSFGNYLMTKAGFSSNVMVFSKEDSFLQWINSNITDILLISPEFYPLIKDNTNIRNLFLLCEKNIRDPYNSVYHIFKYQSGENLIREIMSEYKSEFSRLSLSPSRRKTSLIGIFSPLGRCGKTSLGLSLGIRYSRTKKCLFISLDSYSFLPLLCHSEDARDIADLAYFHLQSPENFQSRLISIARDFHGLSMIPPLKDPGQITDLTCEVLSRMLKDIVDMDIYDYIFTDFSSLCHLIPVLSLCDFVVTPTIESDSYSSMKVNEFLSVSRALGLSVQTICLPDLNFDVTDSKYILFLQSEDFLRYTLTLNI